MVAKNSPVEKVTRRNIFGESSNRPVSRQPTLSATTDYCEVTSNFASRLSTELPPAYTVKLPGSTTGFMSAP